MKITVYTITDCKFSQAEKQYLQTKGIQFEEKNLEANREYLTEMLNISNNFAGTPVTKIQKDDGQIIVLKGFTQDEFDKALVIDPNAAPQQNTMPAAESQPQPAAAAPTPQIPEPMPVNPAPFQSAPAPMAQPMTPPPQPMAPPMDYQQAPVPPAQPPQNQPNMAQNNVVPPMPPQQPVAPMDSMSPQPAAPAPDDQALNSVLQNLQNRAGDAPQA